MVFIRNPQDCRALTAVAGEAMEVGMLVKLVQGAAIGDVPNVVKAVEADYADANVIKGIVMKVQDNDLAVDFIMNPQAQSYTANTGSDGVLAIASGDLVTFWYHKPIVGYHKLAVDTSFQASIATVREMAFVSFDSDTAKLSAYNSGDTTEDVRFGFVYRNDNPEVTVLFHTL